jgi:MATE family, multidrug efflux pump
VSQPAPRAGSDGPVTRLPELEPAAAFPLEPHQSIASVLITGEHATAVPRLVSGSLPRTIVRVGLPAVASSLLMTLFFTVDSYWIGTRVGATGLAAGSTSVFWIWMVVSVAEMVSIGLTAVAARRHGEGRASEASRIVGEALLFSLALGCLVGTAGVLAVDRLFELMQTPPEVTAMGRRYLVTYLVGSPLIYGFFAIDAAFRAAGDTRTPFLLLAISVAVTLVLDPVLIMGLWGAPRLGIAGAAIATVCTRGAAFVMGSIVLVRRGMVRFGRLRAATIRSIARVGLPTATTGVVFGLIYVAVTRTTTRFGTPALAALGIGHRVESWLYMVGVGFGAAAAAIVGQNLGARRVDRAEHAGWIATGYGSAVGVLFFLLQLTFAEQFAGIFTNDPAVIAEGARYLRIASFSQLAITAEIVLEGALGGAGHTLPPMLTSTAITLLRIPLATWAAARWGTEGIWWTISLTAFARGVAMAALWRSGGWKRRSL